MSLTSILSGVQGATRALENVIHPAAPVQPQTAALSASPISLGEFDFEDFEVPEHINIGGRQNHTIHTLSGGRRVVDAHGAEEDNIRWSGTVLGEDAAQRVRQLDEMRRDGRKRILCFPEFDYDVLVVGFTVRLKRATWIEYDIECVVLGINAVLAPKPGLSVLANADLAKAAASLPGSASGIAGSLQAARVLLSTINSSAQAASDFVGALEDVRTTVSNQIANTNAAIRAIGSIGEGGSLASKITNARDGFEGVSRLSNTLGHVGRTISNVRAIGTL